MSFLSDAAELLKRGLASQRRWPSHARSHVRGRKAGGRRPVPMEIGAYQVTDVLGSEGELVFLKAWDEAATRWVRLMAMPLEEGLDATERLERMACLHRAADPLTAVQHENVLQVYGLEYHDGWGCVVAEYLDGVRLSELLATEETLPPAQVAPLGAVLASVMAAAQEVGIEIKGLSPEEIVLTSRGEIKVCSFVCRTDSSRTGEPAGEASGLCRLGALLYRCLTGRQPAVQASGEKPVRRAVTPISAFRPSVPSDLERLIMGLMIFDTEEVRLSVPVVAGGLARVAEQHGWTWQVPRPVADAEGSELRTAEADSEQVVSA